MNGKEFMIQGEGHYIVRTSWYASGDSKCFMSFKKQPGMMPTIGKFTDATVFPDKKFAEAALLDLPLTEKERSEYSIIRGRHRSILTVIPENGV